MVLRLPCLNAEFVESNSATLILRLASSGKLEVAKWLLTITKKLNIHTNNELPFRNACKNLHFDFVKWLFSLDNKINIHAENNDVFDTLCKLKRSGYLGDKNECVKDENYWEYYGEMIDLILSLSKESLPKNFLHPRDMYMKNFNPRCMYGSDFVEEVVKQVFADYR